MALVIVGVLVGLGAASFISINNKYRAIYQTASWQEALHTAEAGVDLALTEIRRELWDSKNQWSGWTDATGNTINWTDKADENGNALTSDGAKTVLFVNRGVIRTEGVILRGENSEGGHSSTAYVEVDAPSTLVDATGCQWFRIRAKGVCGLPGGRVLAGAPEDANLRKFDIYYDHTKETPTAVAAPQAQRTVEAIVRPVGAFERALEGFRIDMTDQNIVVDSWDSRNTAKYPGGAYPSNPEDPTKGRQWNGNIAATGTVINAGNAHIYGTASTNEGSVLNGNNVTGNDPNYPGGYTKNPDRIRNDFYDEMIPITAPVVDATVGTPSSINGSVTITASTGDPTQVNLTTIKMTGSDTLTLAAPRDADNKILLDPTSGKPVPSYVQLVVSGNISLDGNAQIQVEPGVMVRIFVSGDADIAGNGFSNVSTGGVTNYNSPKNMQLYGVDRPKNADGSPASLGSIKIAGNGGYSGTVYAPNYDIAIKGGGSNDTVFGAFVGNTITMTGVQSVHYDEALGTAGLITAYRLASWFEDAR